VPGWIATKHLNSQVEQKLSRLGFQLNPRVTAKLTCSVGRKKQKKLSHKFLDSTTHVFAKAGTVSSKAGLQHWLSNDSPFNILAINN